MTLRSRALNMVRKWGAPWVNQFSRWFWGPHERFRGDWQTRSDHWTTDSVLAHHALFACITRIAQDIGKLRATLKEQGADSIWKETTSPTFSPILERPNHYQNWGQFAESWIISKAQTGNTYVLKERDNRGGEFAGAVRRMFVLDPCRVKPQVSPDGSVFYEITQDDLAGVEATQVPASEIIHDRMNTLFHPLCGISPIFACGLAAHVGISIERNSASFFVNNSIPSGVITSPAKITQPLADEWANRWQNLYTGTNAGKVAMLGNGATFAQLRMTAADSQLIEQLKLTAEMICSAFHVPAFKVGVGPMPTYQNGEILNQIYYSDCLQSYIEAMERALDFGLGLDTRKDGRQGKLGIELDLDGLLRMDTATLVDTLGKAVGGSVMTPNEARAKVDLPPLTGGDTVYMQQQNFSLSDLDKRSQSENPFSASTPAPAPESEDEEEVDEDEETDEQAALDFLNTKELLYGAVHA